MPEEKNSLKKIRSGAFSRGFALARVSALAGARAAGHAISQAMRSSEGAESRRIAMLMEQMKLLTSELGRLKGSVMKLGQLLSLYGEHFFPPEVNAILKTLQSDSPPMEWAQIDKILRHDLAPERLAELEIDPEPLAAASLGQVHRAKRRSDGLELALKIQYPGVDRAIDSDVKTLRTILSVSKLIPNGPKYDAIFDEVKTMLHREVDYGLELETTRRFREAFADVPEVVIPRVFPEYSGARVLATSLEAGEPVGGERVAALSQERRNRLAAVALNVFFREIYSLREVQTDPHFGNYRIRIGEGEGLDRIVLLDFGAVREFSREFVRAHAEMAHSTLTNDRAVALQAGSDLGFLVPGDSEELRSLFFKICRGFLEPFCEPGEPDVPREFFDSSGAYDWGKSDLPKRVIQTISVMALGQKLRSPPGEVIFLDRKMGGLFIFLQVLKARIAGREILLSHLRPAIQNEQ